jgi:threonine dehydrogenase-like Zn-dependent dehydrogenase
MGKIAVVTDVNTVEVREYPVPDAADDGLVIKIETCSICGSDKFNLTSKPAGPRPIGHEFVGRIVSIGANANQTIHCFNGQLALGDRIVVYPHVTCGGCEICLTYGNGNCICQNDWMYGGKKLDPKKKLNSIPSEYPYFKGGFAEYVYIVPNTFVWKVPDDMPSTVAVLLDPCAVAMRAVEQTMTTIGALDEGTSVTSRALIIGAGPIGIMAGMILRTMGVEQLLFTDFNDQKLGNAKEISGADDVVNLSGLTLEEKIAKVKDVTSGGPNIIIAAANSPTAAYEGLQMIRPLGTYVEIGAINKGASPDGPVLANNILFKKNAHITSVVANTPTCFNRSFSMLKRWRQLPFQRLITHEFNRLEDLVPTSMHMSDPDYLKGVLVWK